MVAVFPDWVLLDRFAFRRDANTSLPEKGYPPLRAQGTTSEGVHFGIALCLADPPGASRLYVLFPSGTDPVIAYDVVVAHGNHVLFMITDLVKPGESSSDLLCHQDLFICRVASPDHRPLLRRLPTCTDLLIRGMVDGEEMTMQYLIFPQDASLLCRRDEQLLVVAQLDQFIPISDSGMWEAELSVLNTDFRCDGAMWEVKRLLILHPEHEKVDFSLWSTDAVIPFKNYICWADYYMGGILFIDVFEERPKVSYLELPNQGRSRHPRRSGANLEMYRGVSVTDEGRLLKFVHVDRDDGKLFGASVSGYTITSHGLEITENGGMQWVMDAFMGSDGVLPSVRTDHDFNILKLPLVCMEAAHVVHFLYSERTNGGYHKVSVVTVDMNAKTLLSTHPYMKGEDRFGEDADMYEVKCCNLKSFLAVKFPMCVFRKRKILDADSY